MATSAAAPQPSAPVPRRRLSAALARRRNPLHRRCDTLRAVLVAALALSLTVAAVLSIMLGFVLYHNDRAAEARHDAGRHQVQGVALSNAGTSGADTTALMRWIDAAGATHQANAPVPPTTVQGDQLPVWLGPDGVPTTAPASAAQAAGDAVILALGTLGGSALVLFGGYAFARYRTDRSTDRSWEREWAHVEPDWSGHR